MDVVCLQETCAESFESDFDFMIQGDKALFNYVMLNKGRMRNATFWRKDKFDMVSEKSKDRTLITKLRKKETEQDFYVVNCHLSAGPQSKRRLKQMHAAMETIRKEVTKEHKEQSFFFQKEEKQRKKKEKQERKEQGLPQEGHGEQKMSGTSTPLRQVPNLEECMKATKVIVCGDFNSQGNTGVKCLLEQGMVDSMFRESGDPTESGEPSQLTSKQLFNKLSMFEDAYEVAYASMSTPPPSTLICPDIMDKMVDIDTGEMTAGMTAALRTMYNNLCSSTTDTGEDKEDATTTTTTTMTLEDVNKWLIHINGELGRGSEYRSAMRILEETKAAAAEAVAKNEGEVDTISFTFDNFKQVYREELCGGKYWGVEHDVSKINGSGMKCVGAPAFEARFDYVYFTSNMKCTAVSMVLTDEQKDCIYDACTDVLPNSWHPSDHLPLRASFQLEVD